jgi:serine/threonine-protein kinase
LNYCLDDGSALIEGPAVDERTAILPDLDVDTILLQHAVPEHSIAVLPFVNISSDPENEFFCDGLAEEILNALTKIESLKVAARTSAFSFKGTNTKVSEIGKALGVRNVLEGSVRKVDDRVRITVQLANAADGYHLWSERYDREMKDIFAVEDEITLAVVEALRVKLLGSEKSAMLKKATDNPAAYELYLRGRAFWNKRTPADLDKAIESFEKAIAIDPGYSLAYAGIADSYALLAYFEAYAPSQLRERARAAARKAIELDEGSAESHTAMALYVLVFEFDWAATEFHFERALEINPRYVPAQYIYGTHLAVQKRFDEAVRHGQIALDLDPLNLPLNGNVARALYFAHRYEDAIRLAEKNLELAPDFFFTHWILGVCYRQMGLLDKAISHLERSVSNSGILALKGDLGVALAQAGRHDEARRILASLDVESRQRYVSPQWSSVIHAALGEKEKALELLERAWDVRAIQLLWLAVDPNFDPLRDDPVFQQVFAKMKIPTSYSKVTDSTARA